MEKSSLRGISFIHRFWLEGERVFLGGGGLKKEASLHRNCPLGGSSLLLTEEGFIVYSKSHLLGVLGQAQRERSLVKMRLMAPMR